MGKFYVELPTPIPVKLSFPKLKNYPAHPSSEMVQYTMEKIRLNFVP